LPDKELITLYLDGSQRAFELFYTKYKDNMFRYIVGMCGDHEHAMDICATTWETFIKKCHLVNDNPSAYLFAISRSQLSNFYRKQPSSDQIQDTEAGEEHCPTYSAELSLLMKQINQLPWHQREALLLKHLAGFSLDELAKYQGINQESAKSRVRYAVKKIRNYFSLSGETL
jgi:RNA polymerase sigma factor (sigma-70 family)